MGKSKVSTDWNTYRAANKNEECIKVGKTINTLKDEQWLTIPEAPHIKLSNFGRAYNEESGSFIADSGEQTLLASPIYFKDKQGRTRSVVLLEQYKEMFPQKKQKAK